MRLFSDPAVGIDDPLLRRAFLIAERGRGTVSPNPLVGCVVARDGVVVGEGYHARAGLAHAEVVALDAAGESARGADAYVTLEPCNHYGRTPPCVERLLEAGVASVTIGMRDPNTKVSGGGAEALAARGVAVRFASDDTPFLAQNEAWLTRLSTGRPFVRVKVALSLDGRLALEGGRRATITGAGARDLVMRLRAQSTAILVGARTLVIDDPLLTVRGESSHMRDVTAGPRRVVLCRESVASPSARMFSDGGPLVTVLVPRGASERALRELGATSATVLSYSPEAGLSGALEALAADGIDDVFVEAGPGLFTALKDAALIDELITLTAGGLAGRDAPGLYDGSADQDGDRLAPVFAPVETGLVGEDVVTVWRPRVTRPGGPGEGSGT
ncbi:MAG: bifunctional diaminohydroxyphosphoribosylaminopyrimidine deaminase/5-amino-6-(5-phosphoribosylamino)uracil reductase RibD [Coriobacteriia bacterium]|nr:bifunctional diaminohydroxyphosphoribosylaminopyrimidine deaminase/5-amino-6-(5-phosphoribosylamino)uracil reductase RibD [Coriobacteriia bacterium]